MTPEVLFVCVMNRVRSTFTELFLNDLYRKQGVDITVSSAGYIPQVLRDRLTEAKIPFPSPLYGRSMSEVTNTFLVGKGISVPAGWRSKELNLEMIAKACLVVTALHMQKDDLCSRYEDEGHKIFSIRELLNKEQYLFFEDFSKVPMDARFWHHCEEDPEYVTKVLQTWESTLITALPNIIKRIDSQAIRAKD